MIKIVHEFKMFSSTKILLNGLYFDIEGFSNSNFLSSDPLNTVMSLFSNEI